MKCRNLSCSIAVACALVALLFAGACAYREGRQVDVESLTSEQVDYARLMPAKHLEPRLKDAKTLAWNSRHLLTCTPGDASARIILDYLSHTNHHQKLVLADDENGDGETDFLQIWWWQDERLCSFVVEFGGAKTNRFSTRQGPAIALTLGEKTWVDAGRYDGQWDKRATGSNSNAEYLVEGQWLPAVASTNGHNIVVFRGRRWTPSFAVTNVVLTPLDADGKGTTP